MSLFKNILPGSRQQAKGRGAPDSRASRAVRQDVPRPRPNPISARKAHVVDEDESDWAEAPPPPPVRAVRTRPARTDTNAVLRGSRTATRTAQDDGTAAATLPRPRTTSMATGTRAFDASPRPAAVDRRQPKRTSGIGSFRMLLIMVVCAAAGSWLGHGLQTLVSKTMGQTDAYKASVAPSVGKDDTAFTF